MSFKAASQHSSCGSRRSSQQTIKFAKSFKCNRSSCPSNPGAAFTQCNQSNGSTTKSLPTTFEGEEVYTEDCNGNFTLSGSKPAKTAGPLSKRHDFFAKYAPCGHWSTCKKDECVVKKSFEPCNTCSDRGNGNESNNELLTSLTHILLCAAPYGPYGPWSKNGPSQFSSPKAAYIKQIFPFMTRKSKNGAQRRDRCQPMGKMAPWPLSGSCRYAGRPYGPCRPFGSFKSRGPFGYWTCKTWPTQCRPATPVQPCWKSSKGGRRPCTPCHRPLFRPCKPTCPK